MDAAHVPSMSGENLLQQKLGRDSEGYLTIATRPEYLIHVSKRPLLERVPDEVVMSILEFATRRQIGTDSGEHFSTYDKPLVLALTRTSRRFYRLSMPILYRELKFSVHLADATMGTKCAALCQAIESEPSLGQYCRKAYIVFPSAALGHLGEKHAPLPITTLTNVKSLRIDHIPSVAEGGNFLKGCASVMHRVVDLQLFGFDNLTEPLQCIPLFQSLRALTIADIDPPEGDAIEINRTLRSTPPQQSAFSSLLFHCDSLPRACVYLEWLLSVSTALTSLSVACPAYYSHEITLPELAEILGKHKRTLKRLDISHLCVPETQVENWPDLSSFSALEELEVSRWQSDELQPVASKQVAEKLLAPNLRRFIWNLSQGWDWVETIDDLCWPGPRDPESDWLRKFARTASDVSQTLEVIRVKFDMGPGWAAKGINQGWDYPWSQLEAVEVEFLARAYGFSLEYPEPCMSRREWLMLRERSNTYPFERSPKQVATPLATLEG